MNIRDQRNSNNFHGYKKIDLIINSKFVDPNKHTAKELHHMDLQETILLRIKRGRWSHLSTKYGPQGLQRTTHASLERHQWRWWTPSEMVSRLDLVVLDSVAAGWYFVDFLGFWYFWGIYRAKRRSRGHPRWAQPTRARRPCTPWWVVPSSGLPQVQPGPNMFLLFHK